VAIEAEIPRHFTKAAGKTRRWTSLSFFQVACATINILYLGHFKFFPFFSFSLCLFFLFLLATVSSRQYYIQDKNDARRSNALFVCSHYVCITVVYDGLFRMYFRAKTKRTRLEINNALYTGHHVF